MIGELAYGVFWLFAVFFCRSLKYVKQGLTLYWLSRNKSSFFWLKVRPQLKPDRHDIKLVCPPLESQKKHILSWFTLKKKKNLAQNQISKREQARSH